MGAQDKDKVRCNAVRAIGNIIYLCQDIEDLLNYSKFDVIEDSIKNLFVPPKSLLAKKNINHNVKKDLDKLEGNKNIFILSNTEAGLNALLDCLKKSNDMKV